MNRWSPERTKRKLVTKVQDAALRGVVRAAQEEHTARFRPFRPVTDLKTFLRCSLTEEIALTVGVPPNRIGAARTLGRRKAELSIPNIAPRSKV